MTPTPFQLLQQVCRRSVCVTAMALCAVAVSARAQPMTAWELTWHNFGQAYARSSAEFNAAKVDAKQFTLQLNHARDAYWTSAPESPEHQAAGQALSELLFRRDLWLLDIEVGFHTLSDVAAWGGTRSALREGDALMPESVGDAAFYRWTHAVRTALGLRDSENPRSISPACMQAALDQAQPAYAAYFPAMMDWEQMNQCHRGINILKPYVERCETLFRQQSDRAAAAASNRQALEQARRERGTAAAHREMAARAGPSPEVERQRQCYKQAVADGAQDRIAYIARCMGRAATTLAEACRTGVKY